MHIYKFSTSVVGSDKPWETTVAANNDVQAVAAAATWVQNLAETMRGTGTEVHFFADCYEVRVDYADHASASIDGFGHVRLDFNPKGGLLLAKVHVDRNDGSVSLPYLRFGVNPGEVVNQT